MSHYRCCCGDSPGFSCCAEWCDCPEEVCVSSPSFTYTVRVFACGDTSVFVQTGGSADPADWCTCDVLDGTLVGTYTVSVSISNYKMRRVVPEANEPCGGLQPCGCIYKGFTGEGQTGEVTYKIEGYQLRCFDCPDCTHRYYDMEGEFTGPMSGSDGMNWTFNLLEAYLHMECCQPQVEPCDQCSSCRARLFINFVAGEADGLDTLDCCDNELQAQGFRPSGALGGEVRWGVTWACRHPTRWVGTCPIDLSADDEPIESASMFWQGGSLGGLPFNDQYIWDTTQNYPRLIDDCAGGCGQSGIETCWSMGVGICTEREWDIVPAGSSQWQPLIVACT